MIITDFSTSSLDKPAHDIKIQEGDLLKIKEFNELPSPVTARIFGGGEYWIETLDVQTGCMRLDVSGQIDLSEFSMVKMLIDANGNEYDPDDFWVED